MCFVDWTTRQRNRQQIFERGAFVLATVKSKPAAKREQSTASACDESLDTSQFIGGEKACLDAADDQTLVREQLFFSLGKTGRELHLVPNTLAIKLVLTRALKRNHRDVLLVGLKRLANLSEFPTRLAFDV